MPKSCDASHFSIFTICLNLFWGPTGGCYQEPNNLGVRAMVVEIRPRL